ncbi:hypothetical protein V8C43DRAFT_274071 [Trichoderma afarasin]
MSARQLVLQVAVMVAAVVSIVGRGCSTWYLSKRLAGSSRRAMNDASYCSLRMELMHSVWQALVGWRCRLEVSSFSLGALEEVVGAHWSWRETTG